MLDSSLREFAARRERFKLLLVDDQPINILALNEVFKEDFDLLMATTGEQALQQARDQQPDLILLDVVMPGLSGHDVCRRLKADPVTVNIPVIFVTSQSEGADEAYGLEMGAADFISKPVNPVVVKARVKTQLLLKLQHDFLRNIAMLDGLTGIANRRRFDEDLQFDWQLCLREGRPLALLLLDIDFFKRYNDHYGHQAGDDCLRAVASTLQRTLRRSTDLICRYGGEEFICLLPLTDAAGAAERAVTLLDAVRTLHIPHAQSPTAAFVTVSIGGAALIPTADMQSATLVQHADAALYASKGAGRGRFTLFTEGTNQALEGLPSD